MQYWELKRCVNTLEMTTIANMDLPVSVGLTISRNLREMKSALEIYHELCDEYIRKYSNGAASISPGDTGYKECLEKLHEIERTNVNLTLRKIKAEEIENLCLPLGLVMALEPMIKEALQKEGENYG